MSVVGIRLQSYRLKWKRFYLSQHDVLKAPVLKNRIRFKVFLMSIPSITLYINV